MTNCIYCHKEITNDGDFCGNCGFINFDEKEDIFKRLIKQFKYLFINPVTFIRTSRLANPIFTGFTAMMIILIELIITKGTGEKLGLDMSVIYGILLTFTIIVSESSFMFGIVKGIFKKNVNFMAFINLTLSIYLISFIINIIGAILGVVLTPLLFTVLVAFGSIVSLLLMYQGIKDLVQANIMVHIITIIGSFAGTALLLSIILKLLIKSIFRSIL